MPLPLSWAVTQLPKRVAVSLSAASERAEITIGHARSKVSAPDVLAALAGASATITCALAPPKPKEFTPTIRGPFDSGNGSISVGTRSFSAVMSM